MTGLFNLPCQTLFRAFTKFKTLANLPTLLFCPPPRPSHRRSAPCFRLFGAIWVEVERPVLVSCFSRVGPGSNTLNATLYFFLTPLSHPLASPPPSPSRTVPPPRQPSIPALGPPATLALFTNLVRDGALDPETALKATSPGLPNPPNSAPPNPNPLTPSQAKQAKPLKNLLPAYLPDDPV